MENKGIVLSDDLLKEYLNFRSGKEFDVQLIKKIINYLKGGVFFNLKQLKEIGVKTREDFNVLGLSGLPGLVNQIFNARNKSKSIEELSKESSFKIILSNSKNDYPYVNINNDNIENNLCGFFYPKQSRNKAIEHIRDLCLKAKKIILFDKYFYTNFDNINTLIELLPNTDINLICYKGYDHHESRTVNYLSDIQIEELNDKRSNIKLNFLDDPKTIHDRYLLIDDTLEIILTSGFEYLGEQTKDFAYIIRKLDHVSNNRFND
jgi:hypothetical protein